MNLDQIFLSEIFAVPDLPVLIRIQQKVDSTASFQKYLKWIINGSPPRVLSSMPFRIVSTAGLSAPTYSILIIISFLSLSPDRLRL